MREILRELKCLFLALLRLPVLCLGIFAAWANFHLTKAALRADNTNIMKPSMNNYFDSNKLPPLAVDLPLRKDGTALLGPHESIANCGNFCAHAQEGSETMEPSNDNEKQEQIESLIGVIQTMSPLMVTILSVLFERFADRKAPATGQSEDPQWSALQNDSMSRIEACLKKRSEHDIQSIMDATLAYVSVFDLLKRTIVSESINVAGDVCEEVERERYISAILDYLDELSNAKIKGFRVKIEKTKGGKEAVKNNPNRRLYAVAKPDKQENTERIIAALRLQSTNFLAAICNSCDIEVES